VSEEEEEEEEEKKTPAQNQGATNWTLE